MPYDENQTCENCFFHTEFEKDGLLIRCRFNAPMPGMYNLGPDMTKHNITRYPKCPGPGCGQWKPEEVIEIEEVIEPSTIKE
jgi:hypothetical protein